MNDDTYEEVLSPLCKLVAALDSRHKETLTRWWAAWLPDAFDDIIARIQQYITIRTLLASQMDDKFHPSCDAYV